MLLSARTSRGRVSRIVLVAITVLAGFDRHALAEGATPPCSCDPVQARRLEQTAVDHAKKKQWPRALEAFEGAYRAGGRMTALRGVADTQKSMGRLGQAIATYRALLARHRDDMSAIDKVLVERAIKDLTAKTGVVDLIGLEQGSAVHLDGDVVEAGPPHGPLRAAPGPHKLRIARAGYRDFEVDVTVVANKEVKVKVSLEKKADDPSSPTGDLLDFCKLAPGGDGTRYVKQRAVLFDVATGTSLVDEEEERDDKGNVVARHKILRAIDADKHVREVLATTFPMVRFHNVIAKRRSPSDLRGQASIAHDKMVEAAGDDAFAAYSIGCSDWVALPRLERKSAGWKKVKKKKSSGDKEVEYLAWNLDVVWSVELDIYKRGAREWTLVNTAKAENGGLLGAAFGMASQALTPGGTGPGSRHISKRPDSSCKIPKPQLSVDNVLSLAGCLGISLDFGLGGMSAPGSGQSRSSLCKDIDDDASKGEPAMRAAATCASRVASEQVAIALQKEAKKTDGWRLFAPLQDAPKDPGRQGISMGKDEGAHAGDGFVAVNYVDGKRQTMGFARIVRGGPGGTAGIRDPSLVRWRIGEHPTGTRMEEYPQIGILAGLQPSALVMVSKGDSLGTVGFGATIEGGYNASRWIPVGDEFWSKIHFTYFYLPGGDISASGMFVDLLPETMFYLTSRLAWFGALGFGYASVSATQDGKSLGGSTFGVLAETGLEVAFTPDWYGRLTLGYRQNVSSLELTSDEAGVKPVSAGTFSGLRFAFSGSYVF